MRWDPEPPLETADSREWWEATRRRQLTLQRCRRCQEFQHYPRSFCLSCLATDLDFVVASGRGQVYSFTEVARSPDPARYEAPYLVALVRLEEGPVIFTRLVGITDPHCEQNVRVDWYPLADGRHLPVFTSDP